jgi:hypothetical protein
MDDDQIGAMDTDAMSDAELDERFVANLVDAYDDEIADGAIDRELASVYCW